MSKRKSKTITPHFPPAEVIKLSEYAEQRFREEASDPDKQGELFAHEMDSGWPAQGIPEGATVAVKSGPVTVGQLIGFFHDDDFYVNLLVARNRSGITVEGKSGKVNFLKRGDYKIEGLVVDTDLYPMLRLRYARLAKEKQERKHRAQIIQFRKRA